MSYLFDIINRAYPYAGEKLNHQSAWQLNSIGEQLFGDSYVSPSKTRALPGRKCVLFHIIRCFCYINNLSDYHKGY